MILTYSAKLASPLEKLLDKMIEGQTYHIKYYSYNNDERANRSARDRVSGGGWEVYRYGTKLMIPSIMCIENEGVVKRYLDFAIKSIQRSTFKNVKAEDSMEKQYKSLLEQGRVY
jgi:hypothetical protein